MRATLPPLSYGSDPPSILDPPTVHLYVAAGIIPDETQVSRPTKRRRLRNKQAPPPEGLRGLYDVTKAHIEHIEAFGGVYGKVWAARNTAGQPRLLKQVKSHSWQDGLPEHGVREVAILKDLESIGRMPHVMKVHDVLAPREGVTHHHRLHIVAEHANHDLVTYTKAHDLSASRVQRMAWELTLAVDYLHARGVLHRNLKPASVLVKRNHTLVVCGFETAIRRPPEGTPPCIGGGPATGFILRTHIAVRAPELLLGLRQDDTGMDIWALGCCVAFLALNGSIFQPDDNTDEAACREIFQKLGWPGKDHPLARLENFARFAAGVENKNEGPDIIEQSHQLGDDGVDLLSRFLDLDYTNRISAAAALRHAYFSGQSPIPEKLALSPTDPDSDRAGRSAASKAARYYLARDMRRERSDAVWRLVALTAVQMQVRIPGLCQHVWGFLVRPASPSPDYMLNMVHIKEWMRAVLVDWLVEVHWKWRLQPAALLLAVWLLDRYLARNPNLPTQRFQLLGVAALFLAAKIEDENYDTDMSATSLAWITDRAYTAAQVLEMEADLATSVGFQAPSWGAYHFLAHYTTIAPLPNRYFFVAQCFLEQSQCLYRLSRHSPSLLASACYYLAALHYNDMVSKEATPMLANEAPDSFEVNAVPEGSHSLGQSAVGRSLLSSTADPPVSASPGPQILQSLKVSRSQKTSDGEAPAESLVWPAALAQEAGRDRVEVEKVAQELLEAVRHFEARGSSGKPLVAVRNKFARGVHHRASELVWPDLASPA